VDIMNCNCTKSCTSTENKDEWVLSGIVCLWISLDEALFEGLSHYSSCGSVGEHCWYSCLKIISSIYRKADLSFTYIQNGDNAYRRSPLNQKP